MNVHADVLIVGCGDIGQRVAQCLTSEGASIRAIVSSDASAQNLAGLGIAATAVNLDVEAALPAAKHVFWFAPPPPRGSADSRLRRWLDSTPQLERLVYISTSGVYGDCDGRWIDEDESLKPQSDRGKRRLDAETALREFAERSATHTVTLRVPGIYGPGRLPVDRLQKGLPVLQESECPWTNRIHADDLAHVAIRAMARGRAGTAYNVSDGHPTTMSDYFLRCANLLGLPEPRRVTMAEAREQFTPSLMSFLEESKRLINRRMLDELGVVLRHRDLAAGLPSCLV